MKKLIWVLVVLAVLVILAGGYWYVRNSHPVPFEVFTPEPTSQATTTVDTTGWKTYRNEQYGFEISLPPDFQSNENNFKANMGDGFSLHFTGDGGLGGNVSVEQSDFRPDGRFPTIEELKNSAGEERSVGLQIATLNGSKILYSVNGYSTQSAEWDQAFTVLKNPWVYRVYVYQGLSDSAHPQKEATKAEQELVTKIAQSFKLF